MNELIVIVVYDDDKDDDKDDNKDDNKDNQSLSIE